MKKNGKQEQPGRHDPKAGLPDSLKKRLIGIHQDGTVNGVVQAALTHPSSDTRFVKEILERTEKMLQPIRNRYGSRIDIGVEGSYQQLAQVESLAMNGLIATVISILLVVMVLLMYFRTIGVLAAILLQVGLTSMYTLGITGLVYGRLNLYTVFVIAILLGMGIDYSIHVVGHAQKSARKGMSWEEAFIHTLGALFKPMFLAALTTIAGMLTLLSAEFVGFYEFGVIAAIGIALNLVTSILFLPAFVFLLERFGHIPVLRALRLPVTEPRRLVPRLPVPENPKRLLSLGTAGIGIGSVLLLLFFPGAGFEHDFNNLRDRTIKPKSKRHYAVAASSNRKSSQPVVAFADKAATMVAFHDTLQHRLAVEKDPMLRSFLTLSTFVPPEDRQAERMELIEEIGELISARVFNKTTGNDSTMILRLRRMTEGVHSCFVG